MGGNLAIGNYSNVPWLQPTQMNFGWGNQSGWGDQFGWGNQFSWNGVGGYSGSNSIYSSSEPKSYEERRIAEEEEKARKREEYLKDEREEKFLTTGLSDYVTEYEDENGRLIQVYADKNNKPLKVKLDSEGNICYDSKGKPIPDEQNGSYIPVYDLKHTKEEKQRISAGKQEDGSSIASMSVKEYREKTPLFKRIGRGIGNALEGMWEMGKSLVGFDKDGKWNPKKFAINVAMLAGSVALIACCPAAAPVLLYAGLGAGAIRIGKGVIKTCTADTVDELDKAWQDIGAGVATVAVSKAGIKGMGKSAGIDMSGFKLITKAGELVKAQPEWIFASGIKGSGGRFVSNLKSMNPFQSKTEKNLSQAEAEYQQLNNKLNDGTISDAEFNKLYQLDQDIIQLKNARMTELINSPLKWLRKSNRVAIKQQTGKGVFKSYVETNTSNLSGWGKAWFFTKKIGKVALDLTMPAILLWNAISKHSWAMPAIAADNLGGHQYYSKEGLFNSLVAPNAVKHLTAEDTSKRLQELEEQQAEIEKKLA